MAPFWLLVIILLFSEGFLSILTESRCAPAPLSTWLREIFLTSLLFEALVVATFA